MYNCSAVIIASGKATRLGETCSQKPKCMLPFNGIPFLRYVIFWLLQNGIENIFITGNKASNGWMIEKEISNNFPSSVCFVSEKYAKSTAYSSFMGVSQVTTDHTLLLTSDNIWDINLQEFYAMHLQKKSYCSALVTTRKDVPNYGLVKMTGKTGNIISFYDRENKHRGVSASTMGFYLLNTKIFLDVIDINHDVYVERESMERLLSNAYGFVNNKFFFDFGTLDNLKYLSQHPEIITKYFGFPE